jgi:hypothetical protein
VGGSVGRISTAWRAAPVGIAAAAGNDRDGECDAGMQRCLPAPTPALAPVIALRRRDSVWRAHVKPT